jgi:hypothetical protein
MYLGMELAKFVRLAWPHALTNKVGTYAVHKSRLLSAASESHLVTALLAGPEYFIQSTP